MPLEHPDHAPEQAPETPPTSLEQRLDVLRTSVGQAAPVPDSLDSKQIDKRLDGMIEDGTYGDYQELNTYNVLVNRLTVIQRQADWNKNKANREEFMVANQAITYHEYLGDIVDRTISTSDSFAALKHTVGELPPDLLQQEKDLSVFLTELQTAIDRRMVFADAALVQYQLSKQQDVRGNVMKDQGHLVEQFEELKDKLDGAGKAAILVGGQDAITVHKNALDQKIVDLIAKKGDLPARALLALQFHRFQQLLEEQKTIIRDPKLNGADGEWEKLNAKNDAARENRGEQLTETEGKRFLELQDLRKRWWPTIENLGKERRDVSNAMLDTTEDLSEFHEHAMELTIIQHMFQTPDSLEGAQPANPRTTPEEVRSAVEETLNMRAEFHRERMGAFANKFQEDVLKIGAPELIEDLSNKTGREFIREMNNRLTALVTLPLPEKFGIRSAARGALSDPLNEAMGWPAEKSDMQFSELTPQEQQRVLEKSRSIADAIRAFDQSKITRVRESLDLIAHLPPASDALGEPVQEPLPDLPPEGITTENMQSQIEQYGLATVYILALKQADIAYGSPDSGEGFLGEVQKFTDAVNDNIDVHLEVGNAMYQASRVWEWVMYACLVAAGATAALIARPLIRAVNKGRRSVSSALRRSPRTAPSPRSAPAVETPSPATAEAGAAQTVASETTATRSTAAETVSAEVQAARRAKLIGHAGFLLAELTTVGEIAASLQQTMNAQQLTEPQTVDAAAEFWQSANLAVNGQAGTYGREDLEQALVVTDATGQREWVKDEYEVVEQMRQLLQLKAILQSKAIAQSVPALKERGEELEKKRKDLLQKVDDMLAVRKAEFPVFDPAKKLTEQAFTRDGRAEGRINVNTSGHYGIFPVKFRDGPIQQLRTAGAAQRTEEKFTIAKEKANFRVLKESIEAFQWDVRSYLEDYVKEEEKMK